MCFKVWFGGPNTTSIDHNHTKLVFSVTREFILSLNTRILSKDYACFFLILFIYIWTCNHPSLTVPIVKDERLYICLFWYSIVLEKLTTRACRNGRWLCINFCSISSLVNYRVSIINRIQFSSSNNLSVDRASLEIWLMIETHSKNSNICVILLDFQDTIENPLWIIQKFQFQLHLVQYNKYINHWSSQVQNQPKIKTIPTQSFTPRWWRTFSYFKDQWLYHAYINVTNIEESTKKLETKV